MNRDMEYVEALLGGDFFDTIVSSHKLVNREEIATLVAQLRETSQDKEVMQKAVDNAHWREGDLILTLSDEIGVGVAVKAAARVLGMAETTVYDRLRLSRAYPEGVRNPDMTYNEHLTFFKGKSKADPTG
jgi:predicted transcriptional regulator YheO